MIRSKTRRNGTREACYATHATHHITTKTDHKKIKEQQGNEKKKKEAHNEYKTKKKRKKGKED